MKSYRTHKCRHGKSCQNPRRTKKYPVIIADTGYSHISHIIFNIKMDGGGFEPPKHSAADLQSVPFGLSGTHPRLPDLPGTFISLSHLHTNSKLFFKSLKPSAWPSERTRAICRAPLQAISFLLLSGGALRPAPSRRRISELRHTLSC